jgi:hypothetical protein
MNVILAIGTGIEVAAEDAVKFFEELGQDASRTVSPQALLALAVLSVPLEQAVMSGVLAAASEGANIPLDITTVSLIIRCWPALQAYLKTLTIQPAKKGTP